MMATVLQEGTYAQPGPPVAPVAIAPTAPATIAAPAAEPVPAKRSKDSRYLLGPADTLRKAEFEFDRGERARLEVARCRILP